MVSSAPYYQDEDWQRANSWEEWADWRPFGVEHQYEETNPFMLFGPSPRQATPFSRRPPHPGIKCFKCGGNHWARDCPQPLEELAQPKFPPIERYCTKCCVEHFPKDCADKPVLVLP